MSTNFKIDSPVGNHLTMAETAEVVGTADAIQSEQPPIHNQPTTNAPTLTSTTRHDEEETKRAHTIVLDSSPLILNTPSISSLLAICHRVITTQSVLSEIRDPDARARIETIYLPFVKIIAPKPGSIATIKDFARKTGDLGTLSSTDVDVLAVAYDLECELNGGDWRLRRVPGQKDLNGPKPLPSQESSHGEVRTASTQEAIELAVDPTMSTADSTESAEEHQASDVDSDSDSGGWITPSNIKKHQAQDQSNGEGKNKTQHIQVGTMTNDFAMQNVLLHMNLNLLSPTTSLRITVLRHAILRCHGCFTTSKDMEKQFCPSCGKPTMQRVTCTTDSRGQVKLHLKKNFQWNKKGNVYSIPKPASGKSNQKWTGRQDGGGKKGWGQDLMLAEDQKEYVRAMSSAERRKGKESSMMDADYLPSILTGERSGAGSRVKVGAGRGVNSRKR